MFRTASRSLSTLTGAHLWHLRIRPGYTEHAPLLRLALKERHRQRRRWYFAGAFAITTCATLYGYVSHVLSIAVDDKIDETGSLHWIQKLVQNDLVEDIQGHYKNRIRAFSHPYKIFKVFASQSRNGEPVMTPEDFMQSLLTFRPRRWLEALQKGDPEASTTEALEHRQRLYNASKLFFSWVDTNEDGVISYSEYMLFMTLLSTPESSYELAFKLYDADGSGTIEKEEFIRIIDYNEKRIHSKLGAKEREIVHRDSRQLLEHLFGTTGETGKSDEPSEETIRHLSYQQFSQFLRKLRDHVLRLEFYRYPVRTDDTISLAAFADAVVAYSSPRRSDQYLQRLWGLLPRFNADDAAFQDSRISLRQFLAFHRILDELPQIRQAFHLFAATSDTGLTRDELSRLIQVTTGTPLSQSQIEVLFLIFDENNDGHLNSEELLDALSSRRTFGA